MLDEREKLRASLGSFWSEIFTDEAVLTSLLHARAQLDAQTQLDFMELLSSISRLNVPVFHTDNWFLLTLRQSDKDNTALRLPKFDGTYTFGDPVTLSFDDVLETPFHAWAVPPDLKQAPAILNRIVAASLTLTHGVDYLLQDGVLVFRNDPFENPYVPVRGIYENSAVIDRELQLWVYRGQFDWRHIAEQFGYVIGLKLPSSEPYKRLVNAVLDGITEGPSRRSVLNVLSAVCDVPLVLETQETVETIDTDSRAQWVVTDKHAYEIHPDAAVIVNSGDVLSQGDPLCDTLRLLEFNRGQTPSADVLRSLGLGKGFLASGYYGDVVFENTTTDWLVTPPSPDTGNYTRMEFTVHGAPGDVEKFWDDVHAAGVARGQTLAMLLDTRDEKIDQPTAANLPTTVNPVQFLCENILRVNYGVAVVQSATLGRNALGLHHARILRKIVPPHTALLIYAELELGRDEIIMEGSGDETKPGVSEEFSPFLCGTFTDEIDPADLVEETVRFRQIVGQCI